MTGFARSSSRFCLSLVLAVLAGLIAANGGCHAPSVTSSHTRGDCRGFTFDHGGIIRGPRDCKQVALIFTGGEHGEGTASILDALRDHRAKASFFVTGDFTRNPLHWGYLRRMVAEGHYLGPHSDAHLLYCAWEDRDRTLVSRSVFRADLEKNLADLARFGPNRRQMRFFIPPYEWYNRQIVEWAREMGLVLFNFTPGTRSNTDYMADSDPRFIPSGQIVRSILDYEALRPDGLNGFLLLLHLGAGPDRTDKMHPHIASLLAELVRRGYVFVRVDEMLAVAASRPDR